MVTDVTLRVLHLVNSFIYSCSDDLKQQLETRVTLDRASVDEKETKSIQVKLQLLVFTRCILSLVLLIFKY